MKRYLICIFVFSFYFFVNFQSSYCQKMGITGAEFLKFPIGARQCGIGGAFVGVGDDVNSLFWNPGGLSTLKTWGFSAMHSEWLSDLRFDSFGFSMPVFGRKTAVGIMAGILSMPSWDNTDGLEPEASAQDIFGGISLSRQFMQRFYIGATAKYIKRKLADFEAAAMAFDLGIIYKKSNWLTLGGSLQNVGQEIKFLNNSASLPAVIRGGGSFRPLWGKNFDFLVAIDGKYYIHDDIKELDVGTELCLFHDISLRAGYKMDKTIFGLSSGLGFRYGMFAIDYSYNPFDNKFSNFSHVFSTHQISLTMRSISPIPFQSYSPGPQKNRFSKQKKNYAKIMKELSEEKNKHPEETTEKVKKLQQKEQELEQFFTENKNMIFYLDSTDTIVFKWQPSDDPDPGDSFFYRIYYASIDRAPGNNLQEKLESIQTGVELCNSKEDTNICHFEQLHKDTVQCEFYKIDSLTIPEGRYAWWVEAYDQDNHTRKSKGDYRLIDIRYTKPPIHLEPKNKKKIPIKWEESGDHPEIGFNETGLNGEVNNFAKQIPGGGIDDNQQQEKKIITKHSVQFKWRPAVLGFGDQDVTLIIYNGTTIDSIKEDSNNKNKTANWLNDSSVVVDFPIPDSSREYYWNVFAKDVENRKTKTSNTWSFTLNPPKPPKVFIAGLQPDTLYVKHISFVKADIPLLPVFFFEPNSDYLDSDSQISLNIFKSAFLNATKRNPDVQLIITGYCDSTSDSKNLNEAENLAYKRAKKVSDIILSENPEFSDRITTKKLSGDEVFVSRIAKIAESDVDRLKIQAENRRVELKAILNQNKQLTGITSFQKLLNSANTLSEIKQILTDNQDVILILKGRDLKLLEQQKSQLAKIIEHENRIYTIDQPGTNAAFEVKLSGDKIIYRPLPPRFVLAEYDTSRIQTNIETINAPSPFDWQLEISSSAEIENENQGDIIGKGTVETYMDTVALPVKYHSNKKSNITRDVNKDYLLYLTITPWLGNHSYHYSKSLKMKYTNYQIMKDRKIIIQYHFDTVIAESEFLETQVEDFVHYLLDLDPTEVDEIIISGHTCNIGSPERNQELSQERADKVCTSLQNRLAIYASKSEYRNRAKLWMQKLTGKCIGYSSSLPLTEPNETVLQSLQFPEKNPDEIETWNNTPRKRSMNRRTQVNILQIQK